MNGQIDKWTGDRKIEDRQIDRDDKECNEV